MLIVEKPIKVRKDNLYIISDRYNMKELLLDLHTSKVFIIVDFYKENQLRLTRQYEVGICGELDVNKLIDDLHIRIQNESV